MKTQKIKIFVGDIPLKLNHEINDWLDQNAVHITALSQSMDQFDHIVITVCYENRN